MKVEVGLNTYTVSEGHILMRSQHYWFTCQNSNDIINTALRDASPARLFLDVHEKFNKMQKSLLTHAK